MPVVNSRDNRQVIQTKFIGPTNTHGARIKAWCQAGSVVETADHAKSIDERHAEVAMTLARKFGWESDHWVQGGHPSGTGSVFVRLEPVPAG